MGNVTNASMGKGPEAAGAKLVEVRLSALTRVEYMGGPPMVRDGYETANGSALMGVSSSPGGSLPVHGRALVLGHTCSRIRNMRPEPKSVFHTFPIASLMDSSGSMRWSCI